MRESLVLRGRALVFRGESLVLRGRALVASEGGPERAGAGAPPSRQLCRGLCTGELCRRRCGGRAPEGAARRVRPEVLDARGFCGARRARGRAASPDPPGEGSLTSLEVPGYRGASLPATRAKRDK